MVIIVILGLLLAMMAGFFIAIKSVQLGLRWNIQVQQKQEPTMQNPVKEVMDNREVDKVNQQTANLVDEWLNGKKEK